MSTVNGSRLVGRTRELTQLDAALDRALSGRGGLVLLTGEPGIGKTALAREFVEHAATRGAAWAWGSCWDGGGAPAYWPWVQVGRTLGRRIDLAGLRVTLGPGAPWIAGLLPDFAATLGAPAQPSALDSDQARFRLFDALATLLTAAAEEQPLVVVLDDLHWADASSLLALEFVARVLPDIPLLVIAAYRHSDAHARPELASALGGLARVARRLALEGLGRDEVGELAAKRARGLQGAAAGEPIPERLVSAVHAASAGNPFFVDELVQLLAARGRLHDDASAARPLPLPDGVRDVLHRRLAPLHPDVLEALGAAAVIGGEFRLQTLAAVLGAAPDDVLAWFEQPLRAAIVVAGREPGAFTFAHALVRDTLLERLSATQRARLHRAIAEALELAHADDLDQHLAVIAHHYLQAAGEGGAERAVDYAARAARRAVGQFAYDEAARLYGRAIDVAASMPADTARAWQLAQGLGEARMRAGDIDGALAALRAAAEHARRLDDPQRLAQTALASTLGAVSPGLVDPVLVALLEDALERVDGLPARDALERATIDGLRCRLRVQLALALYWSPARERRERLVDEALALAREIHGGNAARASQAQRALADRTLAFALTQGFVAVWGPDTVTRGLPISIEALELCERNNDAELALQVRLWRISLLLELDDAVRAEEEIEAFGRTARRLGQPRMLVYDPLHGALAAQLRGDFAAAERLTADAIAQSRGVPGSIAPIVADAQTFLVGRLRGRQAELEPMVRRNADRLPAMRRWRCGLALVLAELGRVDEARRELEQLAAADFEDLPRDGQWLVTVALLAELCAALDDRLRARRLYELLAGYEGRNVVSLGAAYLGPVARYLGLLAMTMGEDERALGHLETARSAATRMGARPAIVLTALDTAALLARRNGPGDAQRGLALVERVAADAAQMQMDGAVALAARLCERLEDAVAAQAVRARPAHAALRREQDVWLLDYDGRSICLQDAKGLHHLATLLARPGAPVGALELAGAAAGGAARGTVDEGPAAALAAYRTRALDLREELVEAQAFNDPERVARARDRLEQLAVDVAQVERASSAAVERARINVTRAIKATLRRIAEHEPELGRLLHGTVRTGTSCVYRPDEAAPLTWHVER